MARMHEACKYYKLSQKWLSELDLHDKFYSKPVEAPSGKGFGSTEAARGALSDWIVLDKGKIENYQVITPTAWNIGPQDGKNVHGPMEQAFMGHRSRIHQIRSKWGTLHVPSIRAWFARFIRTMGEPAVN